ncbi:MAG: hypothetical protein O9321_08995 [Rubrivivax sp.]|jgi:hypothetical protein|nr:hypothetical protein [Rubrivivax sp.]
MTIERDRRDGDTATSEPLNAVIEVVRRFASARLKEGDSPAELSFALAFVATEMGLCLTRGADSLPVFQAVLHAVSSAAPNGAPVDEQPERDGPRVTVPAGATVH